MRNLLTLNVLLGLFLSCASAFGYPGEVSPNDTARILAGMDAVPGLFTSSRVPGVYADLAANLPNSRLNSTQQRAIREFSRTHLSEAFQNTTTVFYPFGGPDVVFPILFFPNMKTLILAGLESPGSLPTDLNSFTYPQKIADIRQAYSELFKRGYYVTSKMTTELQNFGTTTMISVGLVTLGNKIVKIEYSAKSVKITYSTPQNETRYVYYFQGDLSDKAISPAFVNFIQSQNITTTFYKASSYVPHLPNFTTVNDLALAGHYFVQSDTGLPLSTFAQAGNWSVHLFGQYVPPAPIFGVKVQPGIAWGYANSICKSKDATATAQFSQIWAIDPCSVRMTNEGQISVYDGALPFKYDYAGKLSPAPMLNFSSNLVYAVHK